MKRIFLLILTLLGLGTVVAQQGNVKPDWADGYFRELQNSYIEVVSGTGTDHVLARNNAAKVIVERRNFATGQRVNVQITGDQVTLNGSNELTVMARILDEYAEHNSSGHWVVYLLVQTAKNPTFEFEPVTVTDRYPFGLKALIPGMAQLDKGQTAKGIAFTAAEVATVGGIVVAEGLRNDYKNRINSTHNAAQKADYISKANTCTNLRNVCIAGAAAVYVWNLVDALASKGPKRIQIADMNLTPWATPDGMGLTMNFNF